MIFWTIDRESMSTGLELISISGTVGGNCITMTVRLIICVEEDALHRICKISKFVFFFLSLSVVLK